MDLRGRSVRGGAAVLAVQGVRLSLNMAATVVLARLLAPEDFGLIAMVAAAANFLMLCQDLGLSLATVQKRQLTHVQISTLFWINAGVGAAILLLAFVAAPGLARLFSEPRLVAVMRVWGLGLLFVGLSAQHRALLQRQMRLGALGIVDLVALSVGLAAAIGWAWAGAGYWALVAQQVAVQAVAALGVWACCRFRPGRAGGLSGVREMLGFGSGLTGFRLLNYTSRNLDDVLVGMVWGPATLGLYAKAYRLLLVPLHQIATPLSAVVVPALSRLQEQPQRFRSYFCKAVLAVASAGMPAVAFIGVDADRMIPLLLGPGWDGTVALFHALAPAAFVSTLNVGWVPLALGRTGRLLRWQLVATATTVAAFFTGIAWGAIGVALAFSAASLALRYPSFVYLLQDGPVRPGDLLRAARRPALSSLAAVAGLATMRLGLPLALAPLGAVVLDAAVFGAVYLAAWAALPGGAEALREVRRLARELGSRASARSPRDAARDRMISWEP